jgi:hypothetical protein
MRQGLSAGGVVIEQVHRAVRRTVVLHPDEGLGAGIAVGHLKCRHARKQGLVAFGNLDQLRWQKLQRNPPPIKRMEETGDRCFREG